MNAHIIIKLVFTASNYTFHNYAVYLHTWEVAVGSLTKDSAKPFQLFFYPSLRIRRRCGAKCRRDRVLSGQAAFGSVGVCVGGGGAKKQKKINFI